MSARVVSKFNLKRLPPSLQKQLIPIYTSSKAANSALPENKIYEGDARDLLPKIKPNSVGVSVWSPPYFVGKKYESYLHDFHSWQSLLETVIHLHYPIIK